MMNKYYYISMAVVLCMVLSFCGCEDGDDNDSDNAAVDNTTADTSASYATGRPVNHQKQATLRVTNTTASLVKVWWDGELVGGVGAGDTFSFSVLHGTHTLRVGTRTFGQYLVPSGQSVSVTY